MHTRPNWSYLNLIYLPCIFHSLQCVCKLNRLFLLFQELYLCQWEGMMSDWFLIQKNSPSKAVCNNILPYSMRYNGEIESIYIRCSLWSLRIPCRLLSLFRVTPPSLSWIEWDGVPDALLCNMYDLDYQLPLGLIPMYEMEKKNTSSPNIVWFSNQFITTRYRHNLVWNNVWSHSGCCQLFILKRSRLCERFEFLVCRCQLIFELFHFFSFC